MTRSSSNIYDITYIYIYIIQSRCIYSFVIKTDSHPSPSAGPLYNMCVCEYTHIVTGRALSIKVRKKTSPVGKLSPPSYIYIYMLHTFRRRQTEREKEIGIHGGSPVVHIPTSCAGTQWNQNNIHGVRTQWQTRTDLLGSARVWVWVSARAGGERNKVIVAATEALPAPHMPLGRITQIGPMHTIYSLIRGCNSSNNRAVVVVVV